MLATFAFALAALSAPPAHAESEEDILIIGETQRAAARKAQAYVRQIGVAVGEKQAARWISPVCPRIIGLGQDHAAMVETRIRASAGGAGVPLAPAGCKANFMIVFTDNAKAVVDRVTKVDASPLRGLSPAQAQDVRHGSAPVRWWYNTAIQSRDSVTHSLVGPGAAFATQSGGYAPAPMGPDSTALNQYSSSLVSTLAVRAIEVASVVVDVERAAGLPLSSVIDYVSLVGLSEVKLGAAPAGSILSLFSPGSNQREMSDRDRAFLKGLYQIKMDRRAAQQQRTLVSRMIENSANTDAIRVFHRVEAAEPVSH